MTDPMYVSPTAERALRKAVVGAGLVDRCAGWTRLAGGRTNAVWRADPANGPSVAIKMSCPARDTPLFPNRFNDECRALESLAGTGIAPRLVGTICVGRMDVLVYLWVTGATWRGQESFGVGRLLGRLHRHPAPPGLRRPPDLGAAILAEGDAMLRDVAPALCRRLKAVRPAPRDIGRTDPVFLHGDPVPGNIVVPAGGPVLIDWQCPALGDPLHDLALALSPAMRVLQGCAPPTPTRRAALLRGYGNAVQAARLVAAEPVLSWRIAAHCAWRISRGDAAFAPALEAELQGLEQLRQQEAD